MQLQTTTEMPALLTQQQVSAYLGKSQAWAERSRWDGTGPRFVKVGKAVRYRAEDVREWLECNLKCSTSER